jgi:hypothetical protein
MKKAMIAVLAVMSALALGAACEQRPGNAERGGTTSAPPSRGPGGPASSPGGPASPSGSSASERSGGTASGSATSSSSSSGDLSGTGGAGDAGMGRDGGR